MHQQQQRFDLWIEEEEKSIETCSDLHIAVCNLNSCRKLQWKEFSRREISLAHQRNTAHLFGVVWFALVWFSLIQLISITNEISRNFCRFYFEENWNLCQFKSNLNQYPRRKTNLSYSLSNKWKEGTRWSTQRESFAARVKFCRKKDVLKNERKKEKLVMHGKCEWMCAVCFFITMVNPSSEA